ncbi:MAG: hypothetical protein IKE65_09110 [Clostridia bacterium]|nr:hypothetical protein [Clostridia bacterium]
MQKKIIALLLALVMAVICLSACKKTSDDKVSGEAEISVSGQDAAAVGENGAEGGDAKSADKKEGEAAKGGESATDAEGKKSAAKDSADAKKDAKDTDTSKGGSDSSGWKKKKNGSYVKGDVRVDVVKYGSASLDEGEELIQQLAEGGLKGAKKLSNKRTDTSVIYEYSGQRIGSKETEFIRFEFTEQKGTGYLITVIAAKQADLNSDISYITDNLAKLAK